MGTVTAGMDLGIGAVHSCGIRVPGIRFHATSGRCCLGRGTIYAGAVDGRSVGNWR